MTWITQLPLHCKAILARCGNLGEETAMPRKSVVRGEQLIEEGALETLPST
jgi:hypothetical protein